MKHTRTMRTANGLAVATTMAGLLTAACMLHSTARAATDASGGDDSYYGNIVLDDDGSFAQEPNLETAVAGGIGSAGRTLLLAPTAHQHGESVHFESGVDAVKEFAVLVFDANGRTVFSGSSHGARAVEWNMRSDGGRAPSHGVFFYRIFAHAANGQAAASAPGRVLVR